MEESITRVTQTLATFCNGVESSCLALTRSLDRPPIPLDSANSTFINSLNRRASSLSGDLNLLETMSFGTVSFEELLGHCGQVYKRNQTDLDRLADRLHYLGCHIAPLDDDDDDDDVVEEENVYGSSVGDVLKELEDNSLLGDSTCLANLGLSEACLATIASKGDRKTYESDSNLHTPLNYENRLHRYDYKDKHPNSETVLDESDEVIDGDSSSMISISEEDYEGLPSYMKSLVSWEDLQLTIEKINSNIQNKSNTHERGYFHADELASMGLGPKGRSYLLMLVRMKRLVVETKDGSIFYKVA